MSLLPSANYHQSPMTCSTNETAEKTGGIVNQRQPTDKILSTGTQLEQSGENREISSLKLPDKTGIRKSRSAEGIKNSPKMDVSCWIQSQFRIKLNNFSASCKCSNETNDQWQTTGGECTYTWRMNCDWPSPISSKKTLIGFFLQLSRP